MSVLIEGMEMPKTCAYCRFIYADQNIEYEQPDGTKMVGGCCCGFTGNVIWNTKRDDDCPLGEVPEQHGRLGDLDRLEQMFADIDNAPYSGFDGTEPFYSAEDAVQIIRLAPTIIEAEGGEI